MSLYAYNESLEMAKHGFGFDAIIMAAMRKADFDNTRKLKTAWPDLYEEMKERYNAPGGFLEGEDDGGE